MQVTAWVVVRMIVIAIVVVMIAFVLLQVTLGIDVARMLEAWSSRRTSRAGKMPRSASPAVLPFRSEGAPDPKRSHRRDHTHIGDSIS